MEQTVTLTPKQNARITAAQAAVDAAQGALTQLLTGIVLGLGHDPDDELCSVTRNADGGYQVAFSPKETAKDLVPAAPAVNGAKA